MSDTPPLNMNGISELLGVGFWRVRQWRTRALSGSSGRRLPEPDVSTLPGIPLWSRQHVERWAQGEGLWPPGADLRPCSVCGHEYALYAGTGSIRLHNAVDGSPRCAGTALPPAQRELVSAF